MGAGSQELFGGVATPEPATAGSYGERPGGFRLPDATRLGAVHLQVTDLERSRRWYEQVLGFRAIPQGPGSVSLGAQGDDRALVVLHEGERARPSGRGRLGLYHVAILLPAREALGRFVRHLAEDGVRAGAGDHLVSEAFYLSDPDGLGIEVYADRPRSAWQRVGRELMMATDPVDVEGLRRAAGDAPWSGMPAGTVIGHVHLHVGDLAQAAAFYSEALGMDRTVWRYPGALFLAAGGYHHHLGANTWAGPGARPAGEDEARLLEWTIEVPSADDVAGVAASLAAGGFAVERASGAALVTRDPWGTAVRVLATG